MANDDGAKEQRLAYRRLRLARAVAIQSYAGLEQALCSLFTSLLQTTPDVAATVFYRTANSRSRNIILTKLLKKRHGSAYNLFWNSAIEIIGKRLDETRNQIVHWHEAVDVFSDEEDKTKIRPNLIPPNYWDRSKESPGLGIEDLHNFASECGFVARSLNMFILLLTGALRTAGSEQPWSDICQKPVVYPPPENHPLYHQVYRGEVER